LGLFVLWLASRGVKWNEFLYAFRKVNYWWVVLPVVLVWLAMLFRAWRWKILIQPLGHYVGLIDCYHAIAIGYMTNYALPRIGEVTRCAVLNRNNKAPLDSLIGTVITERISDLLMLGLLIVIVFFWKIDFFGSFIINTIFHPSLEKLFQVFHSFWIPTLIIGLLSIAFAGLGFLFRHRVKKIATVQRICTIVHEVVKGIQSSFRIGAKGEFWGLTLLIWGVCYWFMTWIPVFAMPATSRLGAMDGLFLLVVGGLAFTAPIQGGIGIFHAMITLALTTLYGIRTEEALAFAILLHESEAIFYIVMGALSFVIVSLRRTKQ
jgi:uncharacterized membrane protein YbhN (UPF0104 family)